MKATLSMTINGCAVSDTVEPRQHLADFLREQQLLTGTHLGCEHGICGACTVLIDGEPARSCITYAVACDGAEVTTIEGLDDDPVTATLRRAFTEEHALQCGYCTPGMLITARDIVRRLPGADDERIRVELSSNLCRCTGYMGITRAVRRAIEEHAGAGAEATAHKRPLGPVGSGHAAASSGQTVGETGGAEAAEAPGSVSGDALAEAGRRPSTVIEHSFTVRQPPDAVWRAFGDIESMVRCMPGAELTAPVDDNRVAGRMQVKLGPIRASFTGEGEIERDAAARTGVVRGIGRDQSSGTRARGEVTYTLREADSGNATDVDVRLAFSLAGPLAHFGRSGIVQDLAERLTAEFARRLEAQMSGRPAAEESGPAGAPLDAGSLFVSVVWGRIRRLVGRLLGRGTDQPPR